VSKAKSRKRKSFWKRTPCITRNRRKGNIPEKHVYRTIGQNDWWRELWWHIKTRKNKVILANHLLAFVVTGLSTSFKIPVAYFFVRKLTGTKLFKLICHVIKKIESEGFSVYRIVTNNASTNIKTFKLFGNGKVISFVLHPMDSTWKLFLSYDFTNLIKKIA
jgi:hypothetical protein